MIFKILKNKQGGTSAVIDYMCNKRINEGTAKVLRGNQKLTREILKSITFKQKLFVCVLSFEEEHICNDTKIVIMNSFERTILPGIRNRCNFLWVEHTDKNRLELNCIITQIDLKTQRSLTVYLDSKDRYRMSLWQDSQNYLHDLTDPNDPSKFQTLEHDKRIGVYEECNILNKMLHNFVGENRINNRDEIINLLNKNDIETKTYEKLIKVKFKDSKVFVKLKGGIYSEEFRDINSIRTIIERTERDIREYANRDRKKIYAEVKKLHNEQSEEKQRYFQRKFENNKIDFEREYIKFKSCRRKYERAKKKNKLFTISSQISNFYINNKFASTSIYNNKRIENEYDKTVIKRVRRKRESQQRALREFEEQRNVFYKRTEESNITLRREYENDKERLSKCHKLIDSKVTRAYEKCRNHKWEWGALLAAASGITDTIIKIRTRNEEYKSKISALEKSLNNSSSEEKDNSILIENEKFKNNSEEMYELLNINV